MQSILDQGGDAIYQERVGDHFSPLPPAFWEDADGELYPWMFEGIQPPLAKLLYNPIDGSVSVDATSAPSGLITEFELTPFTPRRGQALEFLPTSVDQINGVPLESSETMISWSSGEGMRGVVNLGPILPTGLDFRDFHASVDRTVYLSPTPSGSERVFVLAVVPEPAATALVLTACCLAASIRPRQLREE